MTRKLLIRLMMMATVCGAVAMSGGCASTPGRGQAIRDAHYTYWTALLNMDVKLKDEAAAIIASAEFASRKRADAGSTVRAVTEYRNLLLKPVAVRTDMTGNSDFQELSKSDRDELTGYIRTHQPEASIQGQLNSSAWDGELRQVEAKLAQLSTAVDGLLDAAQSAIDAGRGADAFDAWKKASAIDPDGAAVAAMERKARVAKAAEEFAALDADVRGKLDRARNAERAYGTAASSDSLVRDNAALAGEAMQALAAFRAGLKTAAGLELMSPQIEQDLVKLESDTAAVTGRSWAESIRLMQAANMFWQAYEYAGARLAEAAAASSHVRSTLETELLSGYMTMLPAAASHYVGAANRNYDQDAFGIAAVLCQMVEEMIQFAKTSGMSVAAETSDWAKRATDTRKDAEAKLLDGMKRSIVIGEFTPGSAENQALAAMVYEAATRQLAGGRDADRVAWGVSVEKANDSNRNAPGSFLIACDIPEFLVSAQPPVEIERSMLKVYRDVKEVPNPAWDAEKNPKAPKTVFSQEVYMYQKIRLEHIKKAVMKLSATCTQGGRTEDLLAIDRQFDDKSGDLAGVRLHSIEDKLDTPFMGPPRTASSKLDLSADPWPKAVSATVSPDGEVANAMQKYAAAKLTEKIVTLVDRYPVDTLCAEAVRQQKLGNRYEAANAFGRCLVYCRRLAGGNAESQSAWSEEKDALRRRLTELSAGRWKSANGDSLAKMADIWSVTVESVLQAVSEQKSGSE